MATSVPGLAAKRPLAGDRRRFALGMSVGHHTARRTLPLADWQRMPKPSPATCYFCAKINAPFPNGLAACDGELPAPVAVEDAPAQAYGLLCSGPSTAGEPPAVATSGSPLVHLRRPFFHALAGDLRRPVAFCEHLGFLCWADRRGCLEHVRFDTFLSDDDTGQPLVLCVTINGNDPPYLEALARRTQILRTDLHRRVHYPNWKLELFVGLEELLLFAPFVAGLVLAHEEQSFWRLVEAPTRVHYRPAAPLQRDCVWSEAAWKVFAEWVASDARVDWWPATPKAKAIQREMSVACRNAQPFLWCPSDADDDSRPASPA